MLVSLCFLAYKRSDWLNTCINSCINTISKPCEIIVNLDGSDESNLSYLHNLFISKRISKLILNNGNNRGVGRSFQNCLGVAEGDYIFKIDTDLIFKDSWLTTSLSILENNPDVGAVSQFDYRHYDPNDKRFQVLEERKDCLIVNDFVSSIYGFRKSDRIKIEPVSDDGNHTKLGKLAITKVDMVKNQGFGVNKSVYISGTEDHPYKTPTFDQPLIL